MNRMEISQKNNFSRFFCTIIFIIKGTRCNGIINKVKQFTQDLNCHGLMPIYGTMYVWIGDIFEIVIFQGFGTK